MIKNNEEIIEELCDIIDSYELDEDSIQQLIDCISPLEDDEEEDSCCGKKRKRLLTV